jgi:hypothetical protein
MVTLIPGPVNLYTHPRFETGVPGSGTSGTITATNNHDTTSAWTWAGTKSQRYDVTAGSVGGYVFSYRTIMGISDARVYSFAVRVRRSGTIFSQFLLLWQNESGGTLRTDTVVDVGGDTAGRYIGYFLLNILPPAGAVRVRVDGRARIQAAGQTGSVWYSGIHLGHDDDAKHYFDGASGGLYRWSGAANASASYKVVAAETEYVIPGGTNWEVNSSFETNTTYWTPGVGTLVQDSTQQKAGKFSGKLTVNTDNNVPFIYHVPDYALVPVYDDDELSVEVWVYTGSEHVGKRAGPQLMYYSDALTQIGASLWAPYSIVLVEGWNRLQAVGHSVPAGARLFRLLVRLEGTGAAPLFVIGDAVYFDQVQIRVNEPLDGYFDGTGGVGFGWNGAAHASSSYRLPADAQGMTGVGGVVTIETAVFKSNLAGDLLDDLSEDVYGGDVTYDIDRAVKGTCKLQVTNPANFPEWSWVKIFQTVIHEGQPSVTYPLGLFRLGQAKSTWIDDVAEIPGDDPTILLAEAAFSDTFNIALGTNYTTAIESILALVGLAGRCHHDTTTRTLPKAKTYLGGTNCLSAVNELLDSHGRYSIFGNPDGFVASRVFIDRLRAGPAAYYWIGQDSLMVGDVTEERNADSAFNYFVVTRTMPDQTVLTATAENDSPSHPFSTVALGARAGIAKVYRTKPFPMNDSQGVNVLQEKANELKQAASMLHVLTFQHYPRPFTLHEVIDIDFAGSSAEHLTGRYAVNSLSVGLAGSAGLMTAKVKRADVYTA